MLNDPLGSLGLYEGGCVGALGDQLRNARELQSRGHMVVSRDRGTAMSMQNFLLEGPPSIGETPYVLDPLDIHSADLGKLDKGCLRS